MNLSKLSDFYDYSVLEEEFEGFDDEDDESLELEQEDETQPTLEERQAKGEWFDSQDGLKSISTLRNHLTSSFYDLGFIADRSNGHWPKQLLDELLACEAVLKKAVLDRQKFRLLIVS